MTTSFSSLPIVDVGALRSRHVSVDDEKSLSKELYHVFATTGFAYLVNIPLTFNHEDVFGLTQEFFSLPMGEKMKLAKKSFRPGNRNTYRGYFPTQPHLASDSLKEGFEIGSRIPKQNDHDGAGSGVTAQKIKLSEPNVWPGREAFSQQDRLEQLYDELQTFASKLLSLLAVALGKDASFFSSWLDNSLSTLRLLHYPSVPQSSTPEEGIVKLSCTPHTDSGILTLLHQDSTGGLEVRNASGEWIAAPYVEGSIVANIGDLMSKVSGGRFTATMHRVRSPASTARSSFGRFSIPFFFEPGENCVVVPVDGNEEAVVYGEHVRKKMSTWVEFQEDSGYDTGATEEM